ncbi:uncharacterized protein FA14DRAFT_154795 [Meira miltonrushii]|uniref:Secreted protein n=1 Tax=Meira miltonrushii TaxID=1280837 RepID=A0A316VE79_9BASI|nr:uncharacterized protein FA14DRAFT_154795 [Meira miltonrushii]PWN35378.1 hypothetical protein FA14DRAFT_154795 [Meira miltonrushii]
MFSPSNSLLLLPLCTFLVQITSAYPSQTATHKPSHSPSELPEHSLTHYTRPFDQKAEIRSVRLENRLAKKRSGQIKQEQYKYDFSVEEAANIGIHEGHSHQQKWVEEHMKYLDTKKNIRMHQLASKIIDCHSQKFRDINHAFNERLDVLETIAKYHKDNTDSIKKTGGTFSTDDQEKQIAADIKRARDTYSKRIACQQIIDTTNAYLKQFDKSKNKCTIM